MSRTRQKLIREAAKEAYAIKAKEINAQNTLRTDYYRGYLWRLFLGSIKIAIPDHWSPDYFRYALFYTGCVCVTRMENVVIPATYTASQYNKWHYPTEIINAGEVDFGSRRIGVDAEIIYMESAAFGAPFPTGAESLIDIYAEKLASCDGAIDINLLVSRTPWLAEVENSAEADDMKLLFTKIMSGEPAVFFRRRKSDDLVTKKESPFTRLPVKENYVAADIQSEKRQIIEEFLTAIGVNNANTDKRERLIVNEVDSNNAELRAAVALWQDNVDRGIRKVKKMFGEDLLGELSVTFGAVNPITGKEVNNDQSNRPNGALPDPQ